MRLQFTRNPEELSKIHEICRSYFAIPGVFKCTLKAVEEARQEFDKSLLEAKSQYSNGKIDLEQFCDILKKQVEPLRKLYHFYKERGCLSELF